MSNIFDEIYARHNQTVFKYVLVSLNFDAGLAEDCMQDIYVLLLDKMDRVAEHPNPGGFLIVTARNFIRKYKADRSRQASRLLPFEDRYVPGCEDEPAADTDYDSLKDELLKKLTVRELSLYAMFYEREYSVADIAKCLRITESNVKVRLFRLRAKVKKMVLELFA